MDTNYFLDIVSKSKEHVLVRSPLLFIFPEAVVNPTNLVWYPWVLVLIRLWVYSLVYHHLAELKSLMDLIPFIH